MKYLVLAGLVLALATPAAAHPHGAKSKRHYGKYHRPHRAERRRRAQWRRYRYEEEDTCSVQPSPQYDDFPYWAACAFTPKSLH
jgi:hypothetical protein